MTAPTKNPYVTCEYGVPGSWAAGHHPGRDYRAAVGTPIMATFPGRVIAVGNAWGADYGLQVIIESRNKVGRKVRHGYCHLSKAKAGVGQYVPAGEVIALSGETGRTFGAHLHYEERFAPFLYDNVARRPFFPGWTARAISRLLQNRRTDHPNARVK